MMKLKDLIQTVVKDQGIEEKIITHKTLTLGFAITFLLVLGNSFFVYMNIEKIIDIQNKINCINNFTNELNDLTLLIQQANSYLSDYIINDSQESVNLYNQKLTEIDEQTKKIKGVVEKDYLLTSLIQPINEKILGRIDSFRQKLTLVQNIENDQAKELLITDRKNAQEINDIINKIESDTHSILENQINNFENTTSFTFLILLGSSLTNLGFLSILYYLLLNNLKIYIYNDVKKDEFINMASHELKTPVTSMKIYSELLQDRLKVKNDKEGFQYAQKIEEQSNKLTTLISDLLDISKIQAGKLDYHYGMFDMNELVKDIVATTQPVNSKHKIVITGNIKRKIYGDKDKIGEVITNLLSNAVKYSPHAHIVNIKLSDSAKEALVSVQDFGMGIPMEYQKKVFERFFRIHNKTYPGMGIGLYICDQIIKRHEGSISVKSIKDKGSTFTIHLPYKGHDYEK